MTDVHGMKASAPTPKTDVIWWRLVAFIIDGFVLWIIQFILTGVFGVERVTSGSPFPRPGTSFTAYSSNWSLDPFWTTAIAVAYFLVQEALFGTTLGKARMGLRVVDVSGERMSVRQAVLRNLIRPLDALPTAYGLGALFVLFSRRHQRIGDMVAGTLVVEAASVPIAARPRAERRRNARALCLGLLVASVFCLLYSYWGRPPLIVESWRNMGRFMFDKPVISYTLGPAQWGWGTATYALTYRPAAGRSVCHALVTLRWHGLLDGWTMASGSSYCQTPGRPATFAGYSGP